MQNGSPNVLLSVVPGVWNDTSALMRSNSAARSPLLRKYLVKLSQRIGMICLPARHQSWRYVGRSSTLGAHITDDRIKTDQYNDARNNDPSTFYQDPNCQEEEDLDLPDIVEDIIELLLSGLRDTVCLKGELPSYMYLIVHLNLRYLVQETRQIQVDNSYPWMPFLYKPPFISSSWSMHKQQQQQQTHCIPT
ncbi:hypothetical protein FXO37_14888 [Capsicum annuum]|nr:hypothetical protein FXO37_14888 [Capsicum annuum]